MDLASTLVFYTHTILCVSYAVYLTRAPFQKSQAALITIDDDGSSWAEEKLVQVVGHGALMMYLLFAEVYLYRSYQLAGGL